MLPQVQNQIKAIVGFELLRGVDVEDQVAGATVDAVGAEGGEAVDEQAVVVRMSLTVIIVVKHCNIERDPPYHRMLDL